MLKRILSYLSVFAIYLVSYNPVFAMDRTVKKLSMQVSSKTELLVKVEKVLDKDAKKLNKMLKRYSDKKLERKLGKTINKLTELSPEFVASIGIDESMDLRDKVTILASENTKKLVLADLNVKIETAGGFEAFINQIDGKNVLGETVQSEQKGFWRSVGMIFWYPIKGLLYLTGFALIIGLIVIAEADDHHRHSHCHSHRHGHRHGHHHHGGGYHCH